MNTILNHSKFFEKRGSIYTIYNHNDFDIKFVQDKISKSFQGVIRGFHGDNTTWKLITCIHGKIKLVTYSVDEMKKEEYILDGDDIESKSILVPPRTLNAHQCLSSFCIFHYKWSEYYTSPENQWSIKYDDEDIKPDWNYNLNIVVSERDKNSHSLKEFICKNKN